MDGLITSHIAYFLIADNSELWTLHDTAILASKLMLVCKSSHWIGDIAKCLWKTLSRQIPKIESIQQFFKEYPRYSRYYFTSKRVSQILNEFYPGFRFTSTTLNENLLHLERHGIQVLQRPIIIDQKEIFKTIAKKQFRLTDKDLEGLDFRMIRNPHYPSRYAYLYDASQIRKVARDKNHIIKKQPKQKQIVIRLGNPEQDILDEIFGDWN
jgi:hypothetical protein